MIGNIQEEIEDKVIDSINEGVSGRLIVVKPEKNNIGADLAVERRGNYKEGAIYFQINSFTKPIGGGDFLKDFPLESFIADDNLYLLFISFDEIRQKLGDYIWLVPSVYVKESAKVVKLADGSKVFRFEAPLDIKNKNEYSKFVIEKKGLGIFILNALEKGGKFNFIGIDSEDKKLVNLETLKEFLCEARRNTYASGASGEGNQKIFASHQLEFQRGEYSYIDVYFSGKKRFMGQEIIYQDAKPVWGMNYISNQIGDLETVFLKESLMKLSEKCRLGETCSYIKREYKYQDNGQGSLAEFFGEEEIFVETKSVYKLKYQGGLI